MSRYAEPVTQNTRRPWQTGTLRRPLPATDGFLMSNIQPSNTRTGRAAEVIERIAGIAIRLGRNGMLLAVPLFIGYVLLGALLTWSGLVILPYPFLSITSDPVFNMLGFIAGFAILLGSAGLLVLLLMSDLQRVGNQLAMLLLGISTGAGAAILRHTHETALSSLLAFLRLLLEFTGVV